MINYVNNAFDKVLKPCDAQRFSIIVNSQETEKHILGHRGGDAKAKSKLPAITYMGVLDSDKYRKYLDGCKQQGIKPQGSRRAEFMRPTGLLMLDFDHVGASPQPSPKERGTQASREVIDTPIKLWEYIKSRYESSHPSLGGDGGGLEAIALAHVTPSGDGLRVVVKRTKGTTIEQEQYEWCKAMKLDAIGIKPDAACKDISRLSFAPMQSEILYFNPSLLFGELPNAEDYPDGSLWGGAELRASLGTPPPLQGTPSINRGGVGEASTHPEGMQPTNCPSVYRGTSTECGGSSKQSAEQYPTDYNGIEYNVIVRRLEEQLGGAPERGARNSFIFTMACNLRYICNDDAAWVASILPTYGEESQKHRMTIQSAINRPMSREMPETMARALNVAKMCSEVDPQPSTLNPQPSGAPALPSALPEPIALLTSCTPELMKAAVAMAVFPPLGAHIKDTRFTYWDGRDYEPTFMNVLVAELSAGKSAVNAPIKYIIADIEASDEGARNLERGWREKCSNIKNPDDRPERPKGLVRQVLSADMTNAAFVQRLADADGHFLYTQMDEIELLNALKTNTQRGAVSAVLRLAFDCGIYGQERVASNAIDAKAPVRWNWNASTTVQRVRKFFAGGIADGTLSRLSFATIIKDEDDWGDKSKPHYGRYSEKFARELLPYLDRIKTCRGTLHCPEAAAWADRLGDELVAFARDAEDRAYAQFSFRAVLMGFFRSMLLYVMNGMQWSREIEDFATWSVKYDLWCKMRFFRDMMHKDLEGERTAVQRGPVGLLPLLPQEFTREQVRDLRIAQGLKPDPKHSLSNWVKRGLIVRDDSRGLYIRL